MASFPTPGDLVRGLHAGDPAARRRLGELLRDPVLKLLEQLAAQYALPRKPADLVRNALRLAEAYLRSRPDEEIGSQGWRALLGSVLMHLGRVLSTPHGRSAAEALSGPTALPECPVYDALAFYQPYDRVGDAYFGGDWFIGQHDPAGALWVLVADITGHGYSAYLLASALPHLWRMAWEQAGPEPQPAEVLANLHELIAGTLPEGVFVEGTLLKLQPAGDILVQPAGGTRLLLRREGAALPEMIAFRGYWLGLVRPTPEDQQTLWLGPGDELVVATDGLYDQLDGHAGRELAELLRQAGPDGLFDWLAGLIRDSLAAGAQKDDITLLLLRRRAAARQPQLATRAADVPV